MPIGALMDRMGSEQCLIYCELFPHKSPPASIVFTNRNPCRDESDAATLPTRFNRFSRTRLRDGWPAKFDGVVGVKGAGVAHLRRGWVGSVVQGVEVDCSPIAEYRFERSCPGAALFGWRELSCALVSESI